MTARAHVPARFGLCKVLLYDNTLHKPKRSGRPCDAVHWADSMVSEERAL